VGEAYLVRVLVRGGRFSRVLCSTLRRVRVTLCDEHNTVRVTRCVQELQSVSWVSVKRCEKGDLHTGETLLEEVVHEPERRWGVPGRGLVNSSFYGSSEINELHGNRSYQRAVRGPPRAEGPYRLEAVS